MPPYFYGETSCRMRDQSNNFGAECLNVNAVHSTARCSISKIKIALRKNLDDRLHQVVERIKQCKA